MNRIIEVLVTITAELDDVSDEHLRYIAEVYDRFHSRLVDSGMGSTARKAMLREYLILSMERASHLAIVTSQVHIDTDGKKVPKSLVPHTPLEELITRKKQIQGE